MKALILPTTEAAEVSPYSISVFPGDITVARGADQLITAELRGFDSDEVFVFSRTGETDQYQRLSMFPADSGEYDLLLLNLVEHYRVLRRGQWCPVDVPHHRSGGPALRGGDEPHLLLPRVYRASAHGRWRVVGTSPP